MTTTRPSLTMTAHGTGPSSPRTTQMRGSIPPLERQSSERPITLDRVISRPSGSAAPLDNARATVAMAQADLRATGPACAVEIMQHMLPRHARSDRRLVVAHAPDSERAAAFRVLRHHLLELGRPQVVVVSSPHRGDGKTTTAVNLALALAECGRAKVLLLEAHLRHPQLAAMFEFVPPRCFADQLIIHRKDPMTPWTLVEMPEQFLHVGAIDPKFQRGQLLDGPAFAIAIERLRLAGYDHIVVDAPPILGSADVNLMADAADTVLLALKARKSTARDLREATEQLGARKVGGTVLVE